MAEQTTDLSVELVLRSPSCHNTYTPEASFCCSHSFYVSSLFTLVLCLLKGERSVQAELIRMWMEA